MKLLQCFVIVAFLSFTETFAQIATHHKPGRVLQADSFSLTTKDGKDILSPAQFLRKSAEEEETPELLILELKSEVVSLKQKIKLETSENTVFGKDCTVNNGKKTLDLPVIPVQTYSSGKCVVNVIQKKNSKKIKVDALCLEGPSAYHIVSEDSQTSIHEGVDGDCANTHEEDPEVELGGIGSGDSSPVVESGSSKNKGRRLAAKRWTGCYSGEEKKKVAGYVGIGIAIGKQMAEDFGYDDAIQEVYSIVSLTNKVYGAQLGLEFRVEDIYIDTKGEKFSTCNNGDVHGKLNSFNSWNEPSDQAIWHLLDTCDLTQYSGVAWVGTVCGGNRNKAVSLFGGNTWLTFAHEMGHLFGAQHSFENGVGNTGGIMDYGNGKYNGDIQFNPLRKDELCGTIENKVIDCPHFKKDSVCGDGFVDEKEECDCGDGKTSCDFCTDCKLDKKKECTPDNPFSGKQCCSKEGLLEPAQKSCSVQGIDGYCDNGSCKQHTCAILGWDLCGFQDDPCKVKCKVRYSDGSKQCSAIPEQWTLNGEKIGYLPDGVRCENSEGRLGTCKKGKCKYFSKEGDDELVVDDRDAVTEDDSTVEDTSSDGGEVVSGATWLVWTNVEESDVETLSDFKKSSIYAGNPDEKFLLTSSEAKSKKVKGPLGSKMTATVTVPEDGDYQFHLKCGSACELKIDGKYIAHITASEKINPKQWEATETQVSSVMTFQKDETIELEVVHIAQFKDYHMAVGWRTPSKKSIKLIKKSELTTLL